MADRLTAQQAAGRAGVSLSGLRTIAARAMLGGVNLRAPRAEWPDARTPLYDAGALDEYLSGRPGRGRRPASRVCERCQTDHAVWGDCLPPSA